MKDQRKSLRVEAAHFISFDLLDENDRIVQSGMALSRNLSQKGVKMENRDPFPIGSKIRLHLAVGDEIADINGEVRHVEQPEEDKYFIGIEFLKIEKDILEKISEYYPDILIK